MGISTKNNFNITRQRGLSIIELMIALSLGLLVLFAVLQVFTASLQSANLQNEFSRVQENARMSIQMLSRDIRAADYWGCMNDMSSISNRLDSGDDDYDVTLIPSGQQGVTGEDNVSSKTIATIAVKDDTDTLTLRGSKGFSGLKINQPMPSTAAVINIVPDQGTGIAYGDLLVLADCESGELFTNTKADPDGTGIIQHNSGLFSGEDGIIGNASPGNLSKVYDIDAQILSPYVKTYFIGQNSAGGDSLFISEDGIASELVRGVTDLQLEYNDGDNNYVSVGTPGLVMDAVRAISVELEIESGDALSASPLVRTYTVTVNIRNRAL